MADFLFIAATIALFAISAFYARFCGSL